MLIENCDFQTPCTLVLSISSAFADRIRCWLLICYDSTDIGSGSSASRWYVCTVWHLWWCMWLSYQLASLLLSMALSYQTSAFEVARAYLVSTITLTDLFICYAPPLFFFYKKSERSELHLRIDFNFFFFLRSKIPFYLQKSISFDKMIFWVKKPTWNNFQKKFQNILLKTPKYCF